MKESKIREGKTYVGKGGSLRKVVSIKKRSGIDLVDYEGLKGRVLGPASVSKKVFAMWALCQAVED